MPDKSNSTPPTDPLGPQSKRTPDGEDRPKRSLVPLVIGALLVVMLLMMFGQDAALSDYREISMGKFLEMVQLAQAAPSSNKLYEVARFGDEEYRGSLLPNTQELYDQRPFTKFRVPIASQTAAEYLRDVDSQLARLLGERFIHEKSRTRLTMLLNFLLPWLLIFALLWFVFFRRLGTGMGGPGGIFGFTRSKAKLHSKETVNITFKDVAGIEEAIDEVSEIVQFLKNPEKFRRIGGRIPRGVLLVGPPGSGKTLLAKAIAGEAGVPFFSMSGSDFVEMFVGVGASRVRDLFRQAKDSAPAIIFVDEIDAVGRRRGTGLGGGHDEREQTLNAILVEMDGFETDASVIVMAATNRPDVLDPALLRPGRFDRQVTIDLPDIKGREKILAVHLRKVKRGPDVDVNRIARATPGFSGADLANIVNEAAIIAAMAGRDQVDMAAFEEARDKVLFGRAKKSRVMREREIHRTANHEAGHAVVQYFTPGSDPLHKVTIIPRGQALGVTYSLPEDERRLTVTDEYLTSLVAVLFGGRVADRLVFNETNSGAANDIKKATELARRMVCEFGMSKKVGPVFLSDSEEHLFLGREIARTTHHGPEMAKLIDEEVRRIVDEGERTATRILEEKRDKLELLTQALLEYETLVLDDIKPLMDGTMTLEEMKAKKPMSGKKLTTLEAYTRQAEQAKAAQLAEPDANGAGAGLPMPKALGQET